MNTVNTGQQAIKELAQHTVQFENSNRPPMYDFDGDVHPLHESESFNILNMVDANVCLINRNLKILWANKNARDLFGQDMIGRQCHEIYSSPAWKCDEIAACLIRKAMFEDHTQEQEIRLTVDDGTEKCFLGKAQVVSRSKDGTPLSIAMIYKETTECKVATEELEKSLMEMEKNLVETIKAISKAVGSRDPYTAGHQQRTMIIARDIARTMGLDNAQISGIGMAGGLHDLGKISVPTSILNKPGKINPSEFSLIKEHPETGYNILKDIDFKTPVAEVVLQHHERLDGSGYPYGLAGDAILLESRVVGVADVIEAIASHRPYRCGLGIDTAMNEIKKNSDTLYDPMVVDAAVDLFSNNNHQIFHA